MQTNNINCRNYETRNISSENEIPKRLAKTNRHEERAEKVAEKLLKEICRSIAEKKCSKSASGEDSLQQAQGEVKADASSENREPANTSDSSTSSANTVDTKTQETSNLDGMTQLINSQDKTSSSADMSKMIAADSSGNVNEEQLQSAIVQYLLEQQKPELGKAYLQELINSISQGNQFEDSVKNALKAMVKQGLITKEEAEKINGQSFRAAQLDSNLDALYDSKGGKNDNTVAVMKLDEALKLAKQTLEDIKSGKTAADVRSLDAASNKKGSSVGSSSGATSGSDGFLWKPVSDSNGKLVVLFPPNLTGDIASAGIYSKEPASYENLIEEGKYTGDGNGGRSHFRFSKPGSSYPDGVFVVAQLKDGSQVTFQIGDSASRNT